MSNRILPRETACGMAFYRLIRMDGTVYGYNERKSFLTGSCMNFLRKITRHPLAFPVFLLATMLIAYGYQINRMGFYWDDWPTVYLASLKNSHNFWRFFAYDRPLSAWLYVLLTPLIGINPTAWQFFAIIARWAGCLGFWIFFKQLWPDRKLEAGFATLLLAIYPGFSQQPISLTYSLFWVLYALFLWSLVASLAAIKNPKHRIWLTILALLASLIETMSMEYVIGLELLRPVFFLLLMIQMGIHWKEAIKKALLKWTPYVGVLCVFVYYRFVYYPQIHTDPEANAPLLLREILVHPLPGLTHLFQNMAQDLSQALVFAWSKSIVPAEIDFTHTTTLFAYAIGLVMAILAVMFMKQHAVAGRDVSDTDHFPLQSVLLGFIAVIMGGLPVWSTNRQIILGMWSDRFSLGLMFGIAILLAGLAGWFSQNPFRRAVFLSVFLALGTAFQVQNTAKYKLNWDAQKDYYNQIVWRIPDVKEGTAILGNKVPTGLSAEYSAGFGLNVIYANGENSDLPIWFFSAISDRGGSIPDYVEGIPLKFELRDIKFDSTTSKGLAVYYKYGESCLRVMTSQDKTYPNLDDSESELLSISHPDQIITEAASKSLPSELFGSEASHGWCYYFQKADLARQSGQWQKVLDLHHAAVNSGLGPKNGTEYAPIIEALGHSGSWEEARKLTNRAVELTGNAKPYFCQIWDSLKTLDGSQTVYETVIHDLDCGEIR
ncbi:hypothetical protein LTAR_00036 [Leptolinea tardivitalis]|nr:hypothetical protein LTAR_00036 [Leptolinea tardivitalis]